MRSQLLVLALLGALLPACGGGGGAPAPTGDGEASAPVPEPIPTPADEVPASPLQPPLDTSFLDLGQPGAQQVTVESLEFVEGTVIVEEAAVLREPSENVVIVTPATDVTAGNILYRPELGRVARVLAVEALADSGAKHLLLGPATTDDLIQKGSIRFDVSPDYASAEPGTYPAGAQGKLAATGAPHAVLADGTFRVEDHELLHLETDDAGRLVAGSHIAGARADMISDRALGELPRNGRLVATITNLELRIQPRIEGAIEYGLAGIPALPSFAWAKAQALVAYKGEIRFEGAKLFALDYDRPLFSAKPILLATTPPLLLHLDVSAGMEASLDVHGGFVFKFHGQQAVQYEGTYRHGEGMIGTPRSSATAIYDDSTLEPLPDSEIDASVKVFLDARATVSLAGLVGPYIAVRPTMIGTLRLPLEPNAPELTLLLVGRAGIAGTRFSKIEDLGEPVEFDLAKFEIDILEPGAGTPRTNNPPAIGLHEAVTPCETAIDVRLEASDLDGDSLIWSISEQGDLGTAEVVYDNGAVLRYVPGRGRLGVDRVGVRVRDARGATDDAFVTIDIQKGRAPQAEFDFTYETNGRITLDASASIDAETLPEQLEYRWSPRGDRSWTPWSTKPVLVHEYATTATRVVVLEVRDRDGMTSRKYRLVSTGLLSDRSTIQGDFSDLSAGGRHLLLLTTGGDVYGTGDNERGQLATGKLGPDEGAPIRIKGLTGVTAIGTGFDWSVVTVGGRQAYGWGSTKSGVITGEYPTYTKLTSPTLMHGYDGIVQWGPGYNHTVGVDGRGQLWGTGLQGQGQLGIIPGGSKYPRLYQPRMFYAANFVKVVADNSHTIALDDDGVLYTWGDNPNGALGLGTYDNAGNTPDVVGRTASGTAPAFIDVATAWDHTLAVDASGRAWSVGDNSGGKLALDNANIGYINLFRQVPGLTGVIAVAANDESSYFLVRQGARTYVYAAGSNGYGQLGDGTYEDRYAPVRVHLPARIVAITAGKDFAAALDDRGHVWTWGRGSDGQLGDGTFESRNVPVRIGRLDD